jgi:tetratricopeptide (TPR) repeat protein
VTPFGSGVARSRLFAPAVALLASVALVGCHKSKGDEMQENMAAFKSEQTADKLFARGQGFAQVGDWTRAEEYLSLALDAGGDPRKIVPPLLAACIQGQKYRVAIQYGTNYLRQFPDDAGTRFIVATLYLAVDEHALAKENLLLVLSKDANNAEAHFALGVTLRDGEGDYSGADKQFREYLRLAPRGKHAKEANAGLLKTMPLTTAPPGTPTTSTTSASGAGDAQPANAPAASGTEKPAPQPSSEKLTP